MRKITKRKNNIHNKLGFHTGSRYHTKFGNIILFLCIFSLLLFSCNSNPSYGVEERGLNTVTYRTTTECNSYLKRMEQDFPEIAFCVTIGTTEEEKNINGIILGTSPTSESFGVKPSVRIISCIHGDEKISSEVSLRLIDYITKNYASSERIKKLLVENTILFIPILNADGYDKNTRANASDADLNRDFTDYHVHRTPNAARDSENLYFVSSTDLFTQAESRAIRDYYADCFDISLSLHAGDVIVNTLFDFTARCIPKHGNLAYELARTYADAKNTETGEMFSSYAINRTFSENGVIMGFWMYEAHGTLQDWSYINTNCIDTTIEVSSQKAPTESAKVNEIFAYNRDAIISYIEKAGKVKQENIVSGFIFSSPTDM